MVANSNIAPTISPPIRIAPIQIIMPVKNRYIIPDVIPATANALRVIEIVPFHPVSPPTMFSYVASRVSSAGWHIWS